MEKKIPLPNQIFRRKRLSGIKEGISGVPLFPVVLIFLTFVTLAYPQYANAQTSDLNQLLDQYRNSNSGSSDTGLQNLLKQQKTEWSTSRPTTLPNTKEPQLPEGKETKPEPSIIEQAYRLQYSTILLGQLQSFQETNLSSFTPERRQELAELQDLEKRQYEIEAMRQELLLNLETKKMHGIPAERQKEYRELQELDKRQKELEIHRNNLFNKRMSGTTQDFRDPNAEPRFPRIIENFDKPSSSLVDEQLTQFGYDMFTTEAFTPTVNVTSVPSNYMVGPGDVIRVNMWGSGTDIQFEGVVQSDGTIALPKLGVIPVGGIRYADIQSVMTAEANKYVQGVNLNVTLVKPRSVEVYVVGQVNHPGLTLVPAFSTVLSALTYAGGPLKTGSLRNISIYRNGSLYRTLDIYDLVFSGNIQDDIFLTDKDVIHIPYIGSTVAVVGAVTRPGIFELKGNRSSVSESLNLAGGAVAQALGQVYIRRVQNNRVLTVLETELDKARGSSVSIRDGDLIEVRFFGKKLSTAIVISGQVWDSKEYNYKPGLKLSRVAPQPGDLKPGAMTNFAIIKRYVPEQAEFTFIRVPLAKIWSGDYDIEMQPSDELMVVARSDFGIERKVYLEGAVWQPGEYEYSSGLTLRDLVAMGGGLKDGATLSTVEISRQQIVNNQTVISHNRINLTDKNANVRLEPYDTVMIPEVKGTGLIPHVMVEGEVRFPGNYAIREGERLSDLIARAGGFLPSAYLYGAEYTSLNAKSIQRQSLKRMIDDLALRAAGTTAGAATVSTDDADVKAQIIAQQSFLEKLNSIEPTGRVSIMLTDLQTFRGSKFDFELSDGDMLAIPTKPAFVNVVGSVYAPNAYLYQPELMVKDYLEMAGGPTKTSDSKYMFVQKANGEVISTAQFGLFSSFYRQKLMPGDTIVVPEDVERIPRLKLFKDVSDIVYRIAVSTGVIIGLF